MGTSLIGPKLTEALENGDRAAAWYEIRYKTNATMRDGKEIPREERKKVATRRYIESEVFGLFSTEGTATEKEARDAYMMYQTNREYNCHFSDAIYRTPM